MKAKESHHISSRQEVIAQIVNPEIDTKRRAAIAKSPPIRDDDLLDVPGMARTWIQFKPGADAQERMQNFQERVGKANIGGVQSSKKSKEQIPEEI